MSFLTPEQCEDFERHNRFMVTGSLTGHRYMVTSRRARDELAKYHRTLYDLDEKRPYCVHDWDVPPEEEMHAINVMLRLPAHENYLRGHPDGLFDIPDTPEVNIARHVGY